MLFGLVYENTNGNDYNHIMKVFLKCQLKMMNVIYVLYKYY